MNNIERALQQFIASVTHLNHDSIYDYSRFEEFNKKESEDTLDYPVIYFNEATDYEAYANQDDVDLENSIKTGVMIGISIYSRSVDDIILFEKVFTDTLSCNYDLKNCCDIPEIKQAYLSGMTNVIRNPLPNNVYRSWFCINCSDCFLPKDIENPIRFELDRKTQKRILEHLFVLESVYHKLLKRFNQTDDSTNKESLNRQISQLEKQISEMFIFKDMCSDNFSYKNHSFEYCYKLIKDKESESLSIRDIFNRDSDRIMEEEEKKKRIAEEKVRKEKEAAAKKARKEREAAERAKWVKIHFSKEGDIQLNRYTDAIIQDLQSNVPLDNIPVYGGSTFSKWFNHYEEGSISYPNILITDSSRYHLDLKSYENETKDGDKVTHEYDTISFPLQYGIVVGIFSDSREKNEEIERAITNYYSEKRTVKVPDYKKQNEFTVITVFHSANDEDKKEPFGKLFKTTLCFYLCNTVYYVSEYKTEEIENNQRFQLRLLQQAEYVLIKLGQYRIAGRDLKSLYKPFIERERILFGLLDSAEYRKLQKLYNRGMPINKDLFDSAMKNIVKCYPDLYQQFIYGWPYSQIESNINGFIGYYENRFKYLMGLLQIPTNMTKHGYEFSCQSQNDLLFYIKKMLDPYCVLSRTVEEYAEQRGVQREREEIERERARAEREAMREEEEYYEDHYSGRRSNGTSILKTAFGVALGNKISGNSGQSKNAPQRKDYSHSESCRRGVRIKNGRVLERSCHGCTLAPYCTKYR